MADIIPRSGANQSLNTTDSPVFGDVTITGLSGNVISSESVETSIEELDNSIYEIADSGFIAWTSGADANTYTIVGGKFQIDRSGRGKIRGKEIAWVVGQQTGVLSANLGYIIYVDTAGTLQATTNPATASYQNTIRLFHVLYDGTNYIVTKENHPANWDAGTCLFLHLTINTVIRGIGAIITRIATGTGADPDDRRVKTVGADTLDDHGLTTTIPTTNPVTWMVFIRNPTNWVLSSEQSDLPIQYNNAGTPTALDVVNAFGIYVLYVAQDNIELGSPHFYAVMNETSYTTLVAAQAAISSGSMIFVSNELKTLEPCQLGYAIVQYSATGGYIEELIVAKSTFSQTLVGGAASGSHNLLTNLDYASSGHTGFEAATTEAEFTASIAHTTGDAGSGKAITVASFPLYGVIKKIKIRADFIAGQQTAGSALVNNGSGIAPGDTSIAYDNVVGSFSVNDYIWIDNECMLVTVVGTPFTVTRAQKGTIAGYHDDNTQVVKANNGLRLVLYKDSSKKEVERILELNNIMTWLGVTDAAISLGDKLFGLTADIKNVDKDDYVLIDDTTDEEAIVQNVNHDVASATYDFTIFVRESLAAHTITKDVYKQVVFDIPTPYKSIATTLYGTLFIDEKISTTVNTTVVITVDKYA